MYIQEFVFITSILKDLNKYIFTLKLGNQKAIKIAYFILVMSFVSS